jgi:hypothetical protein
MLKCINKINIKEILILGDKLLNNLKSKYKNFATIDQITVFSVNGKKVKRVPKASKPWRIKAY